MSNNSTAHINNEALMAEAKANGISVVHVRPSIYLGEGAVTVAFRQPFPGSRLIEIATSICHPRDTFAKKIGTKKAIENFKAGKVTTVPDIYGQGAVGALRSMFG